MKKLFSPTSGDSQLAKEIGDLYERTMTKKEAAEVEPVDARLKPEITKSEEYKMLSGFISEITS